MQLFFIAFADDRIFACVLSCPAGRYNKEFMRRKTFHNKLQELRGNIRVFARCRPILPFEKKRGATVYVFLFFLYCY